MSLAALLLIAGAILIVAAILLAISSDLEAEIKREVRRGRVLAEREQRAAEDAAWQEHLAEATHTRLASLFAQYYATNYGTPRQEVL